MKRHILVLCTVLLSIVLITITYHYVNKEESVIVNQEGVVIADSFTLPNAEGESVSLESIEGGVKVINLWASWSPYSADELRSLNTLQNEYKGELQVVALCRDTNPIEGKEYLATQPFEHTVTYVFDETDEYYKKIDGYAVPETLFLNENNEVIFHSHAPMTYEEMKSQIDYILTRTW